MDSTLEHIHNFWAKAVNSKEKGTGKNRPKDYFKGKKKTDFLVKVFEKHVPKTHKILEIGCNSGRNMEGLHKAGYKDVQGIDINPEAIKLLKETFPKLKAEAISLEDYVENMPIFDTVFSMATFEHIHTDSEWVFGKLKANLVITIEDEETMTTRHFPRVYNKVFKGRQIKSYKDTPLGKGFICRVLNLK